MKTLFNKGLLAIFAVVGMTTLFASCSKDDVVDVVYGNASVRVVNTVSTAAAQDFYQNDTKITTSAVAYGNNSGYLVIKAGVSSIAYKNSSNAVVTAQDNLAISTDVFATSFYFVDATSGTGRIANLADDAALPATGKVRVRFVNFASLANGVGVKTTADGVVSQPLVYTGYTTTYATVDANADLLAYVSGSSTTTTIPGASLVAGKIYTIWFDAASLTTVQYHIVQQN